MVRIEVLKGLAGDGEIGGNTDVGADFIGNGPLGKGVAGLIGGGGIAGPARGAGLGVAGGTETEPGNDVLGGMTGLAVGVGCGDSGRGVGMGDGVRGGRGGNGEGGEGGSGAGNGLGGCGGTNEDLAVGRLGGN